MSVPFFFLLSCFCPAQLSCPISCPVLVLSCPISYPILFGVLSHFLSRLCACPAVMSHFLSYPVCVLSHILSCCPVPFLVLLSCLLTFHVQLLELGQNTALPASTTARNICLPNSFIKIKGGGGGRFLSDTLTVNASQQGIRHELIVVLNVIL